jgi:hypothetical protein
VAGTAAGYEPWFIKVDCVGSVANLAGEAFDCNGCVGAPSISEAYVGTESWEVADGVFSILSVILD